MSQRLKEQRLAERFRLLEMECSLQRSELATTFGRWEKRKALAWGGMLATWGARLFAQPRIRWLLATALMSQ